MDALTLLRHAHDAGLHIQPAGDKLLVKGPQRAEAVVKMLAMHKAEVLALLAQVPDAPTAKAGAGNPAAEPSFWRDFFEERAAHRQYDGGYPRVQAEHRAFGEAILEWHRRHGAPADRDRCAAAATYCRGTRASSWRMTLACISAVFTASIASCITAPSGVAPPSKVCMNGARSTGCV